ncbi:hypothetical protein QF036_002111 [Arthrobacter globiformis]|nr:hypothetical protein [Arthrobacter globiformis]
MTRTAFERRLWQNAYMSLFRTWDQMAGYGAYSSSW